MTRIAYIGVGHWHLKFYLEPVLKMDDCQIVGVCDPDPDAVQAVADRVGCPSFTDYRHMCETAKPDFVFVLGRHVDMADAARYLIDAGLPFTSEKPVGVSVAELEDLTARAEAADAFAAVSYPWRQTPLADLLRQRADSLRYVMFRRLLGPPTRYLHWGSEWMLDRPQAAGGCTLNLSVHWIDLFNAVVAPRTPKVVSAYLSSGAYQLSIEDYSLVTMQTEGCACVVETGYIYPGPAKFDMNFSIKSESDYITVSADGRVTITDNSGQYRTQSIAPNPDYDSYVRDILRRWRAGEKPEAGLTDMLDVIHAVEDAYRISGWSGATRTADDLRAWARETGAA